jgi:hypothetical protein
MAGRSEDRDPERGQPPPALRVVGAGGLDGFGQVRHAPGSRVGQAGQPAAGPYRDRGRREQRGAIGVIAGQALDHADGQFGRVPGVGGVLVTPEPQQQGGDQVVQVLRAQRMAGGQFSGELAGECDRLVGFRPVLSPGRAGHQAFAASELGVPPLRRPRVQPGDQPVQMTDRRVQVGQVSPLPVPGQQGQGEVGGGPGVPGVRARVGPQGASVTVDTPVHVARPAVAAGAQPERQPGAVEP